MGRPPQKIQLGEIVRWGEDTDAVIGCVDKNGRSCRLFPACRLKGVLDKAAAAFFGVLDAYTLADLVKQPHKMRAELEL